MRIPEHLQPAYEHWKRFLYEQVDFQLATSQKHTKDHCARVLLFCLLIAQQKGFSQEERDILCTAAVFHDSRRQDDWLDVGHGKRAAEYYKAFCAEKGLPFQQRCYDVMAYHDRDDAVGIKEISNRKPQEPNAVLLYQVFKDADALDRFRLGPGGLDPAFLRTDEAKSLIEYAKSLWEECRPKQASD